MADENQDAQLLAAFNFAVEIRVPSLASGLLCEAAFAECDGLEVTHEVKTVREGGNNARQVRLPGPIAYGQLSLKRGMTRGFDLWRWFRAVRDDPRARGQVVVALLSPDHRGAQATFRLADCLPLKVKAPALSAKDGMIAVEEFQLAYETLTLVEAER